MSRLVQLIGEIVVAALAVETAGLLQIRSGFEFTALLAAGDAAREPADGGFWAATDGGTEALFRFWMTPCRAASTPLLWRSA